MATATLSKSVSSRYPYYFSTGNAYKLAYILQLMSIISASTLWICIDTINFGLLVHHNAMLKILGHRLALLGWTRDSKGTETNASNYNKLCECIEYHLQITRWITTWTNRCNYELIFFNAQISQRNKWNIQFLSVCQNYVVSDRNLFFYLHFGFGGCNVTVVDCTVYFVTIKRPLKWLKQYNTVVTYVSNYSWEETNWDVIDTGVSSLTLQCYGWHWNNKVL